METSKQRKEQHRTVRLHFTVLSTAIFVIERKVVKIFLANVDL